MYESDRSFPHPERDMSEFIKVLDSDNHAAFIDSIDDIFEASPTSYSSQEWLFETSAGPYQISVSQTNRSINHPDFLVPNNHISVRYPSYKSTDTRLDIYFGDDESATLFFAKSDATNGSLINPYSVAVTEPISATLANLLGQIKIFPNGSKVTETLCDKLAENVYDQIIQGPHAAERLSKKSMVELQQKLQSLISTAPESYVSTLTAETLSHNISYAEDDISLMSIKRFSDLVISPKSSITNAPEFRSCQYPAEMTPQGQQANYLLEYTECEEDIDCVSTLVICQDGTVQERTTLTGFVTDSKPTKEQQGLFAYLNEQGVLRSKVEEFQDLCFDLNRILKYRQD